MYSVSRIMIKEQHPLYSYCMETTAASKRLYNAALFRIRNRFTGYRKVALTDHELQVLEELDTLWEVRHPYRKDKVCSFIRQA